MNESTAPDSPELPPAAQPAPQSTSTAWAYLQLFRAPNVFTAIADVAMGYFVTIHTTRGTRAALNSFDLGMLVGASCLIYLAGMVLNDVFDFDVDLQERPQRPLPSGRIARAHAKWLGFAMLVGGVGLGALVGFLAPAIHGPAWRPALIAVLLGGCVLFYDALAKKSPWGALVMGSCRIFNVLLGMSLHAMPLPDSFSIVDYHTGHLMIAGGIGVYIVGVTVFARKEAGQSGAGMLALGVAIMGAGIAMLAAYPWLHPMAWAYNLDPHMAWPLGMFFTSVWILRRCMVAVMNPSPQNVQIGVKFCLLSLIVLDALVTLTVCPPPFAVGILVLMVPMIGLGWWLYST